MEKRKRRHYTGEYKAEAVKLVTQQGKRVGTAAKELGLSPSVLRGWVEQAQADEKGPGVGVLTSKEREELTGLRQEVKTLRMEREILKKAAAFFAKESA